MVSRVPLALETDRHSFKFSRTATRGRGEKAGEERERIYSILVTTPAMRIFRHAGRVGVAAGLTSRERAKKER